MNDMTTLGFAVVLIGALAAQSTLLLTVTGRKMKSLEQKIDLKIELLDAKIDALSNVMDARFDAVDHRLSALESDVLLIKQHLLSTTAA